MMHGGVPRSSFLPAHLIRALVLGAAVLLLPALARGGDDYERWYVVEMGGKRAGHMHAYQRTEGGRITTFSRMEIRIARSDTAMGVEVESRFVETADHKPVSMRVVQQLGRVPTTTEYTFGETEIAVATTQGERTVNTTRPLPEGSWLTPAASAEFTRQRLQAGAPKIVVRTIDPSNGPEPLTVTMTGIEKTTVEAMGKTVPAVRFTATTSIQPLASVTSYVDEQGVPIRSQVGLGPIKLIVIASDRETALAKADGPAPELMVRTLVTPDVAIPRAREATKAVYVLSVPDGEMPALPDTGAQKVERVDERSSRVTVGVESPAPEKDPQDAAYLASTPMVRGDDPEVRKLAERATAKLEEGADRGARAEAMRAFVRRYITRKDLDVGFASASEVARQKHGDCSEHAVLLAAMLRADGIPARVASGLIYVDEFGGKTGIFGYHMWTQALLERGGTPAWVDLDATLPGGRAFDATHIAMAVSALAEGEEARSLSAILPLMGRVAIKVESVER